MSIFLNVEYSIPAAPSGLKATPVDREIYAALGKLDHSRGYGFGRRDLQFKYKTEEDAKAAQAKILEAAKSWPPLFKIEVTILKET